MAEVVHVLMNISDIDRADYDSDKDFQEHLYDRVHDQLEEDLGLCRSGWIYAFGEVDNNFIDGVKEPAKIVDEAIYYYSPYIASLVEKAAGILNAWHEAKCDTDAKEAALTYVMNNGYQLNYDIRQIAGYVDFGIDKVYAEHDEAPCAGPSLEKIEDIKLHPENYVSFDVTYHV